MQPIRKTARNPRSPNRRNSAAVAATVPKSNLTPSPDATHKCTTAQAGNQRLVQYFDERGGFFRLGHLVSSRTLKRGQQKGKVILTIEGALHRRVTRDSNEVQWPV